MSTIDLKAAWLSLSPDANEPEIAAKLMLPAILPFLGYSLEETCQKYPTGRGNDAVDIAVRKNTAADNFSHTKKDAYLIIELKNRTINLSPKTNSYNNAVVQVKKYLHPSATKCQKTKWGILTNGNCIQLFRKHGRVVYPFTRNIELTADNIEEKILLIKKYIEGDQRALSVTIYNNKGGVGKTTTVINLAGILSLPQPFGFGKKVLVIDFDPNQKDLTDLLGMQPGKHTLHEFVQDYKRIPLEDLIAPYRVQDKRGTSFGFDVIPADGKFIEEDTMVSFKGLIRRSLVGQLKNQYDYILIDSPPGNSLFTEEAINAADVVLMPAKHNDISSFKNAVMAIKRIFPEIGKGRRYVGKFRSDNDEPELENPTALPIFFNGEQITDTQKKQAQQAIKSLIQQEKPEDQVDLAHFFFPKWKKSEENLDIFELPNYAHIPSAGFAKRPGVFVSKKAQECYRNLVQEYFL